MHAQVQPRTPISSPQVRSLREPGRAASVVMEGTLAVTPGAIAVEGRCSLLGKQMSTP